MKGRKKEVCKVFRWISPARWDNWILNVVSCFVFYCFSCRRFAASWQTYLWQRKAFDSLKVLKFSWKHIIISREGLSVLTKAQKDCRRNVSKRKFNYRGNHSKSEWQSLRKAEVFARCLLGKASDASLMIFEPSLQPKPLSLLTSQIFFH